MVLTFYGFMQSTNISMGSKVIGQTKIVVNVTIIFNTWTLKDFHPLLLEVRRPSLNTESSSLEMLCQALTVATISCCFVVSLSAFSFVSSNWNACFIGLKSADWLGIFTFRKLFRVSIHMQCEKWANFICSHTCLCHEN